MLLDLRLSGRASNNCRVSAKDAEYKKEQLTDVSKKRPRVIVSRFKILQSGDASKVGRIIDDKGRIRDVG